MPESAELSRESQFSIRNLLFLFVAISVLFTAIAHCGYGDGIIIGIALVATMYALAKPSRDRFIIAGGIWLWIIGPCMFFATGSRSRNTTVDLDRLRSIHAGLEAYHKEKGCYPPAYTVDHTGKRTHSWRALILPYMPGTKAQALSTRYNYGEPWDSPANRKLEKEFVKLFGVKRWVKSCLNGERPLSLPPNAAYVAVVGPNTMWPGEEAYCQQDVLDGGFSTLAVVSIPASNIHVMEPVDLSFSDLSQESNAILNGIYHWGGIWPFRRWFYSPTS